MQAINYNTNSLSSDSYPSLGMAANNALIHQHCLNGSLSVNINFLT
uniref:Uncharacterized protein n=1 Tax=Manihot esculenta TaxID=3983 RepID=A0A2C9WCF1_MANES